ncbi:MAG: VOC family protein [Acidimicrobiia bacterium]
MARDKNVWPILNLADAPAVMEFLQSLGFQRTLVMEDRGIVSHGEKVWPEGGGVMFGSANRPGNIFSEGPTGAASIYVVTDDPDGVFLRAEAAGGDVVMPLTDQDYGSRDFSVRDPDGNIWSFGTYRGE